MTSTPPPEAPLKLDALGRVRTPRERREKIVDEFERSGVSGVEFARLIGVKYPTLAAWVQGRRKARASAAEPDGHALEQAGVGRRMRWVEAVVTPPLAAPGGGVLRVELPGGARLEIGHRRQVALAAALLRALGGEGAPC